MVRKLYFLLYNHFNSKNVVLFSVVAGPGLAVCVGSGARGPSLVGTVGQRYRAQHPTGMYTSHTLNSQDRLSLAQDRLSLAQDRLSLAQDRLSLA